VKTIITRLFWLGLLGPLLTWAQSHFIPVAPTGLPYQIVVNAVTLNDELVTDSAEIGIFDDTLCVGAGPIMGSYNVSLIAWQADPAHALPGFTPGDTIHFFLWLPAGEGSEVELTADYQVGDGTFGYGAYSVVSLASNTTGFNYGQTTFNDPQAVNIAPNPANGGVYIRGWLPYPGTVQLRIYSLDGRLCLSRLLKTSGHAFAYYWSGTDQGGRTLSTGVYLVRLEQESYIKIEKVTLIK